MSDGITGPGRSSGEQPLDGIKPNHVKKPIYGGKQDAYSPAPVNHAAGRGKLVDVGNVKGGNAFYGSTNLYQPGGNAKHAVENLNSAIHKHLSNTGFYGDKGGKQPSTPPYYRGCDIPSGKAHILPKVQPFDLYKGNGNAGGGNGNAGSGW